MSDDDPVERFVEGAVEPFGDEDDDPPGPAAPQARDMEAELRDRTGADPDDTEGLSEVDGDTATAFWVAVLYVNFGILLLAVGPIVYIDRGRGLLSLALVGGGLALFGRAYMVYRSFRAEQARSEADDESDGDEGDDEGSGDGEGEDALDGAADDDETDADPDEQRD